MSTRNSTTARIICETCGIGFAPHFGHETTARFCSRQCYHSWQRENSLPPMDRLLKNRRIDSNECWLWTAGKNPKGYGVIEIKRRQLRVHRLAWTLTRGSISEGLCVLHKCDTPPCFNPDHLFLGTLADNLHDMTCKGRRAYGSQHGLAKLTEEDVRSIRDLSAAGTTGVELAKRFSVRGTTISAVVNRKNWKHVS